MDYRKQTLAERIAAGEARDLAEELADELAPWIATTTDAERFDVDEFVRRVADREGCGRAQRGTPRPCGVRGVGTGGPPAAARRPGRAACRRTTPRCCPQDRGWRHWAPASFLRLVVDRAGARDEEAEAVLETLAKHIAGGEVNDLISRLPVGAS